MKRRSKILLVLLGGLALVAAATLGWMFWRMGEASYHPGDLAARTAPGSTGAAGLDPAGGLVLGADRPDGSQVFSLEVEAGITIRGFASGATDGQPVIVVHGGPGFPPETSWAGLEAFVASHRFWYPHQRGSGWSDRPLDRFDSQNYPANMAELDAKLGLATQVADIERLRRALGVDRIDLIGHSFGGLIACLYAIEFPAHAGRLLLVAPAAMIKFPAASGGLYEEIRRALPANRLPEYEAWLKDFFDYGRLFKRTEAELTTLNAGIIPFFEEAVATRAGTAATVAAGNNPALTGGWMMQAIFLGLGQRHDWSKAFAGIQSALSLVYGDADLAANAADMDQYRVIPGLRVEVVPGAGHFLLDDAAACTASPALRAWMAGDALK